jgi:hypothetical protein
MEKRIGASCCRKESNARIAKDVPRGGAAGVILARQIWAAAGTKKRRAVSRAAFGLLCVPRAMQRFFSAASQVP